MTHLEKIVDPRLDLQARAIEGQDLQDLVAETRQRLEMTSLGYVVLYHGTSPAAAQSIEETGSFYRNSFFSASKTATTPHAKPKFGSKMVIVRLEVDPRDIEFSSGTGEFYAPDGLVKSTESGKWMSTERLDQKNLRISLLSSAENFSF